MSLDLFKEIIPSLLQVNDHLLTEENEEEYNPYVVNKALLGHVDCLYHVMLMNLNNHLDKRLQYDYYYYTLRKYKRPFSPWVKFEHIDTIELIKEYYGYSTLKAKEALKILTSSQIDSIKNKCDKGGIVK